MMSRAMLVLALGQFLVCVATPALAADAPAVVIKGVTLLSVVPGEPPLPDAEIVIVGTQVACIGVSRPDPAAADVRAHQACAARYPAAQIHDFLGKSTATPGLVEALSRIGQIEIDAEDASHDGVAGHSTNAAHVRAIDGIALRSRSVDAARWGGVTAVLARPLGNALIVGSSVAFRTHGEMVDTAVVRDRVALHCNLGEDAKRDAPVVGARSGQIAVLRGLLRDAARLNSLAKQKLSATELESLQRLKDDPAMVAFAEMLRSGRAIVAHANRADDIAALLRLQRESPFRLVIAGGAEAHVVAETLAAQKVPVILTNVRGKPYEFATRRASEQSAVILAKAGVTLAIATADTHNARNLRWEAGLAAGFGLDRDVALAAVTRTVAEILDLSSGTRPVTGTVRTAGPADLLVCDADPLSLAGHVQLVVTGGVVEVAPKQR